MRITIVLLIVFIAFTPALGQSTLNNGMVAKYYFNNGNANDESGNGNHGTIFGATQIADRFGNSDHAYYFDGIDDYIDCGDGQEFEMGLSDFSLSVWIKEEFINGNGSVVGKRGNFGGTDPGYVIATRPPTGKLNGYYRFDDGSRTQWPQTFNNNLDGAWHHVVMVMDRDDSVLVYLNGVKHGSADVSPLASETCDAPGVKFIIGNDDILQQFFKGGIDDIRLYKRALSQAGVDSLFNENDPMVGFSTLNTINRLSIIPNPSKGEFRLEHTTPIASTKIFDSAGELVFQDQLGLVNIKPDLSKGVYVVVSQDLNGNTHTGRVVIL